MEFDVAVFKGTDLYQNLTQSQKEYTIKVLDDVRSYKAISESKLEISKEFGDRFRTGGEWDVKKKSYDVREGVVSNEYLGNFMYGLAGSVLGIEDKILVSAAAGQQQLKNKGKDIIGNIEGSSRKKLMIATAFEYFNGWFKSVKNNKYDLLFFGEGDNPGDTQKIIDINYKDFNKLRIWQDINKDGVSQTNELKTLDELNIKSLNLNYNEVNQDLRDNNTLTLKGSYTKTNGQTMLMGDINFNVDTINSKFKEDINLTPSQTKIPNVKGYGYLRDLNKAASIDTNLANILDNYSKSNTKEEQLKILPTLIKAWSDTSNNINNNLNPIEEPNNNDTDKTKDQRAYDISLTKIKLPNNISISDGTNVKVDSSGNIVSNDHKSARNLRLTPSQYRALMNNNLML